MPKLINVGTPTEQTIYSKKYNQFRGVDFSQSETMVDDSRSPFAKNVISDVGGYPEKRVGWRTLKSFDGKVNGIFRFEGKNENDENVENFIIHAGEKIYSWSGNEEDEPTELLSGINDGRSTGKCFKGRLFILTGKELLESDGSTCVRVEDGTRSFVPTTWEGRGEIRISSGGTPSWVSRGLGNTYQKVNIATGKRKNTFRLTESINQQGRLVLDGVIKLGGKVKITYIPTGEVLFEEVVDQDERGYTGYDPSGFFGTAMVSGERYSRVTVFRSWEKSEHPDHIRALKTLGVNSGGEILAYFQAGQIPGYKEPAVNEDNICVEYTAENGESDGAISKCTIMDIFENRIFYSGNPDFPNTDWHSELDEPTYVTDLSYTEIGLSSTPIMGYLGTGNEQAIIKDDGEDATIYMRSYSQLSDGEVIFPVRQGTSGIGACAKGAVCTFLDDPLYLSRNGVYAIALQDISSERALTLRSTRVNSKLLGRANLSEAIMCTWKRNLLLIVGDECYVADAAQKTYTGNKTGTFEYEWYYWTNIPAVSALEFEGVLYFGTESGRLCRFNDDMKNSRGDIMSSAYSDDGEAIVAEWSTNLSDDGDFMRYKTMKKKGSGVMLKTYNRSGVKVCIKTDRDFETEILEKSAGIFNFEDLDFNDFTFNTSEYSVVPFNAKFKKYKAIQVICRNDKVNQAFGVLGIIRRYVIGNYSK